MRKTIYILLLVSIISVGCGDELDQTPTKSQNLEISEIEHLYALLDDKVNGTYRNMTSHFYTDDFGLDRGLHDRDRFLYNDVAEYAVWDMDLASKKDGNAWTNDWNFVYVLNTISENISDVSGSEDAKETLKAEIALLRAVTYLNLLGDYCLPYSDENKRTLGLPKKVSTVYTESVKRMTLEETLDFIEEGFKLALASNLPNKEILPSGKIVNWRANKLMAHTYYSRFFLLKHDYKNALIQAQKALDIENTLDNLNVGHFLITNPWDYYAVTINGAVQSVPVSFHNFHGDDPYLGSEIIYNTCRIVYNAWNIPSKSLVNSYDKMYDLRYRLYVVENFSYSKSQFQHPAYNWPNYSTSWRGLNTGATIGELYCIKAECQARLDQWQEGLNTINELRASRIDNSADASVINLSATDKDHAIDLILKERRRELPLISRWFDIKRYNSNTYPADDVTITRDFYEVTANGINSSLPKTYFLEPGSPKFAMPIPIADIKNSKGQLEQNKY
jgi:hypothetical protein